MKKTSGILLTLLLSSQLALANNTYKIDGNRLDITIGGTISSFKLSSIDEVRVAGGNYYTIIIGGHTTQMFTIDKETYEKIMDYMEASR